MKGKFEDYQIYGSPKTDDARLPDAQYWRDKAELSEKELEEDQEADDIIESMNEKLDNVFNYDSIEDYNDFVSRGNH